MASPNIRRSQSRRGPGDPWFTIGTVDVTTSVLVPIVAVVVWIALAINLELIRVLWLSREFYKSGFLWQLFTWPLAESASLSGAITLFFMWSFGRLLEEPWGRFRYLRFLIVNAVLIGLVSLVLDIFLRSDALFKRTHVLRSSVDYFPIQAGLHQVALGVAVCVAAEFPHIRTFFNIPIRMLVGAFVFIEVLQALGPRDWLFIVQLAYVIALFLMTLRSFGLGTDLPSLIPRLPLPAKLTGLSASRSSRSSSRSGAKAGGRFQRGGGRSAGGAGKVVSGPWGEQGTGTASPSAVSPTRTSAMTRADREAVDQLLDKIARDGMESLSGEERARLEDASRRLREGERR